MTTTQKLTPQGKMLQQIDALRSQRLTHRFNCENCFDQTCATSRELTHKIANLQNNLETSGYQK